jgi:nucleoside-diphosphate-sugar epimerase
VLNKVVQEDLEFIINHDLPWNDFANSTVLITGASGYLPAYMLETLLYLNDKQNKGIRVIALTRNKEKALKKFIHHQGRNDLEYIFQDVSEPISAPSGREIHYIIHAASQSTPKYYISDPVGTLSANTIGTINLLKIARKEDLKGFLFFSTGGVYGRVDDTKIPMREDDYGYIDPTEVRACYNESKRMGENICVSWHHQFGIPTKIVRISYVYGPGMDDNDERVFPAFVSEIVNNQDIEMAGEGRDTRSFCYIADATLAFFTVLLKGRNGGAYNVGVEKETSIVELAKTLIKAAPNKNLRIVKNQSLRPAENRKTAIQRSCLDIKKIKALGWTPTIDLAEGIRRTIKSYIKGDN